MSIEPLIRKLIQPNDAVTFVKHVIIDVDDNQTYWKRPTEIAFACKLYNLGIEYKSIRVIERLPGHKRKVKPFAYTSVFYLSIPYMPSLGFVDVLDEYTMVYSPSPCIYRITHEYLPTCDKSLMYKHFFEAARDSTVTVQLNRNHDVRNIKELVDVHNGENLLPAIKVVDPPF